MNWGTAMAEQGMRNDDETLDALFDSARRNAPAMDPAFLERLADDMESRLPRHQAKPVRTSYPATFFQRFRGYFAASGLTGVAALGVWIGFVMPETLNSLAAGYDTTEAVGIGAFLPYTDLTALQD